MAFVMRGAVNRAALVGLVFATAVALPWKSEAQTLEEALANTYTTNPTLAASRAQLRATNEQIAQALSGFRPTVEGTGSAGLEYSDTQRPGAGTEDEVINPASIGISVVQPLYRGGRTQADIRRAENAIQAQRAVVVATEQTVLLDAITAYSNVVREQAVLELAINNEQVLNRQQQAARDRFEVGEVTRTDVSQAESRVSGASADRISAEGALRSARAEYERIIGSTPGILQPASPPAGLPASLEETIALAQSDDPQIIAAGFTERAADATVDLQRGELLPEVNLTGQLRRDWEPQSTIDRSDTASIIAQLSVPLYQAGAVSSRVREARYIANQRRIEVEEARRAAIENAITAWEALATARASIEAFVDQVRTSDIALDGVEQEALVGSRTVLDVLDAEQELLDARVNLVRAQRDEVVAGFQVLSAVGQLTARNLDLPVTYSDFDAHYDATRERWWGTALVGGE